MIKTTGNIFKKFWNDESAWDGYWVEDECISIDGIEEFDIEMELISDAADVAINSGYVSSEGEDVSLESYFKTWLKNHKKDLNPVTEEDIFNDLLTTHKIPLNDYIGIIKYARQIGYTEGYNDGKSA